MSEHVRCMNCAQMIVQGEEYKLEIPSEDPVCMDCWSIFEQHLLDIGATDDLTKWENQEVFVR